MYSMTLLQFIIAPDQIHCTCTNTSRLLALHKHINSVAITIVPDIILQHCLGTTFYLKSKKQNHMEKIRDHQDDE